MTLREEIAAIQARIAAAHAERDTWRASGLQEKYLEAYSRVDALELELDRLRQEGLRASERSDSVVENLAELAQSSIAYDGRQYVYDGYRYDRLTDAIDYSRLHPVDSGKLPAPTAPAQNFEVPDDTKRAEMAELAITYREGMYHLGPYRYSRLADAVNYARLLRTQGREAT